jgi:hypothetical protein
MTTLSPWVLLSIVFLLTQSPNLVNEGAFASADAARELAYLLDSNGMDAIAATDPTEPGRFIAALYFSRSQLLVVSARHPSAESVKYRIEMGQYRNAYLDEQASPIREGKFFVHDSGADGILSALPGGGAVDVLYEDGVRQTLFNGEFERQNLKRSEYDAKLAAADASYARLLRVLTDATRNAVGTVSE